VSSGTTVSIEGELRY